MTCLIQRDDTINLVVQAVTAGIFNDLGSGSNVDVCVITDAQTEMLRNFIKPNERPQKEREYRFKRGTTAIKSEFIRSLVVKEEVQHVGEEMDVS